MKSYKSMTKDELIAEKNALEAKVSEFKALGLNLNMKRGNPSVAQLELNNNMFDGLYEKTGMKASDGTDVRNYGCPLGIPEARKLFADVLETSSDNILIGNSSSLNLMYDTLSRAVIFGEHDSDKPWCQIEGKKWLCPVPGYDRHFKVTETLGFELIPVPMNEEGPDMDVVESLVASDDKIKGMWCVPCYSNPDGIIYSEKTCERIASMKTAAKDFRVFWDNAYVVHHLYSEPEKRGHIPDILGLCEKAGNPSRVYEFASTSKITFAGGGLACMAMNKENFDYAVKKIGVQTICANKVSQLAHCAYLPDVSALDEQMKKNAEILRPKFEKVLEVLDNEISGSDAATWKKPLGGYFISVYVYKGTAKRVVSMCEDLGVALTNAGATYPYGKDPDDSNIRIAPSFPSVEEIEKASLVFATCTKLAAVEKILEEA